MLLDIHMPPYRAHTVIVYLRYLQVLPLFTFSMAPLQAGFPGMYCAVKSIYIDILQINVCTQTAIRPDGWGHLYSAGLSTYRYEH